MTSDIELDCPDCFGAGHFPYMVTADEGDEEICERCNGTGTVWVQMWSSENDLDTEPQEPENIRTGGK